MSGSDFENTYLCFFMSKKTKSEGMTKLCIGQALSGCEKCALSVLCSFETCMSTTRECLLALLSQDNFLGMITLITLRKLGQKTLQDKSTLSVFWKR